MELRKGHLVARLAGGKGDIARAQSLRHLAFHKARGVELAGALDADRFDAECSHVLVENAESGQALACFRLMFFADGAHIAQGYSAQFYDLSPLQAYPGAMVELGRFCLLPGCHDPDVLRLAWAAITRLVDARAVKLMFGCTSFQGTDPEAHRAALCHLQRSLAPPQWHPRAIAPECVGLADLDAQGLGSRAAIMALPPLMRSYLAMGGWVSDHAVIDRAMGTLHVFTGVEVAAIPPVRARALRALAG